ncbi:hypothetical protein [Sinorhizobium meliloti]|uniref:hypothetical protein n=1 Tax=Rhizobium meliloti TaxID=382 RepID=UPI000382CEB6|nr:hypothetical protein [Sinorhizobium meliloti]UDU21088.1 hypothetical protein LJD24_18010 [Sinorhizobium meliloti]
MIDYTFQYRSIVGVDELPNQSWDLFVSAYNPCDRVRNVFDLVKAGRKDWIIHNEYHFAADCVPVGAFMSDAHSEDEFILQYFESRGGVDAFKNAKVCIDVTGFMRPHMLFLIRYLFQKGIKKFDVIYTEPGQYSERDSTKFSSDDVDLVRQVAGYEGVNNHIEENDVLIVNAGYEDRRIAEVADEKEKARKIVIYGLPSLKADMYQQSVLRTRGAYDALGEAHRKAYAPANDPFATATVLSKVIEEENQRQPVSNLFLAPLATKPQALGFGLYYLTEGIGKAVSIIYPFSATYQPDASAGMGRIWKYSVEL